MKLLSGRKNLCHSYITDLDLFTTPKPDVTPRPPFPQYMDSTTTPGVDCEETWTEWFNVSHPRQDGGDFETYERIKAEYPDICRIDMIKDVQCQFNKISVTQIEKWVAIDSQLMASKMNVLVFNSYWFIVSTYTTFFLH